MELEDMIVPRRADDHGSSVAPASETETHVASVEASVREPVMPLSERAVFGPPVVVNRDGLLEPPARRRRKGRRLVLGALVASAVVIGVGSVMGESPLPSVDVPSWPVADDGTPDAATPKPKAKKPKPAAVTKKPKPKTGSSSSSPPKKAKATPRPSTTPTAAKTTTPKKKPATTVPEPRRFAWAPVAGAVSYHVELFRGNDRVLARDTTQPVLELGPTWEHEGRVMRLTDGSYRWYVWTVKESGRDPQAIVQATLTVP